MTLDPILFTLLLFFTLFLGGVLGYILQKKLSQGKDELWKERQEQQREQLEITGHQLKETEERIEGLRHEKEGPSSAASGK